MTAQTRPTTMEELAETVRAAQDEMAVAVGRGSLVNDPLRHVLNAVSDGLGAMFQIFAASAAHHRIVSDELDRQTREAIARAQMEIKEREAQSVQEIAAAIASAAERALARRVNVLHWKMTGTIAFVFFAVALSSGSGGFWWGRASATATIKRTEDGIALAFRDGPAAAASWLRLMQANDMRQGMGSCVNPWTDPQSGRRACYMPVWLDPPRNPAPSR